MSYNVEISAFENMEMFHKSMIYENKWAVYAALRLLYDHTPEFTISETDFQAWDVLCQNTRTWIVSNDMHIFCSRFITNFISHITWEEYEAFTLCKIFLQTMLEENVKRIPIMFKNYNSTKLFLESLDLLYLQKFNCSTIQLLFSDVFFSNVKTEFPEDLHFDIIHVLSHMNGVTPTIKIKRLQPYVEYFNNYKIISEEMQIITTLQNNFNSGKITPIREFYNLCMDLYKQSTVYKQKSTQKCLKDIIKTNTCVNAMCNLNKLYGNILLLALLNKKENLITHHKTLYTDLQQILKCL